MTTPPKSPTPETDEEERLLIRQSDGNLAGYVTAKKARTLEQQRDEALAEAAKWKEQDELGECEIAERGRIIKDLQDQLRLAHAACAVKDEGLSDAITHLDNINQQGQHSQIICDLQDLLGNCQAAKDMVERMKLLGEYASATQYWKIEPHDQKERTAYLVKLLLPALSTNPQPAKL